MKKLTLLTTTALVAGYMAFAAPANAADQGWLSSMKQSVQTWFAGEPETSAEVETYLDEVTIAVPPMTGAEAAQIQPAAGDYVEDEIEVPAINAAPGSLQYEGDTSFNTEFGTQGDVTAFGDTISADDMANIMPAAGDAEEVNDEAVIVADEDLDTNLELDAVAEQSTEIESEINTTAQSAEAEAEAEMSKTVEDLATNNDAVIAVEDTEKSLESMAPAAGMQTDMDVNVDVNEAVTTGTNAGSVGSDAAVTNDADLSVQ
jgi:hypothetical protein